MFSLLLSLLLLTVSSQAPPTDNIILFIEGFAKGLEVEIGNPAECAHDLNVTEDDLFNGYTLIKKGMSDFSISEIEDGLKLWSAGLLEINQALDDCGAGNITTDIEKILKEISEGTTGLLEFIARELLAIIENDVQKLYKEAAAAIEAGNWEDAGLYSGEIVGILLNQKVIP